MGERVSHTILLCEDDAQERLTKSFMKKCGLRTDHPMVVPIVASRRRFGGNVDWVLNEFPRQLHACRQRSARASTLLIVLVDADNRSVEERRAQLFQRAELAGMPKVHPGDPVIALIPKRHIETWISALLGESVNEQLDCKSHSAATKDEIRLAGLTLHTWSRNNAVPGPTCVPSLMAALPEWRKIG